MTVQQNIIKEITQLYAGFSFYYSDFLLLNEIKYNNNNGFTENNYSRIRVIEKNNLGEYISSIPIKDIKNKLNTALMNSRTASVLSNKKTRVYYPYIHTITQKTDDLNYKSIKKIDYKINQYKRKYKPELFDFTINKTSKIIVSNIGTIINQDFSTIKLNIKLKNRKILKHYKITNLKKISFPDINMREITILNKKYELILSPRVVGKLALYFLNNNIDIKTLNLEISPYLYKGVNANLYDDEGTSRFKAPYKGLSGGNIFQKDKICGSFYDFNSHEFIIKQPDLEISNKNSTLIFNKENPYPDNYLLVNDFDSIKVSSGKIIFNCDLSLFGKGRDSGYMIKTIEFHIGELEKIQNITKYKKVIGLEDSSIRAPYIYIGENYE